jgi:hypothetical protein
MKIAYYKVMIVDRPVSLNAYVDSPIDSPAILSD